MHLLAFLALTLQAQPPAPPPASFDWPDRIDHYLYRTYSPQRLGLLLAETGFEHLTAPDGRVFQKRFSHAVAGRAVRNTVEFGAAGLLGEDYRYRESGKPGLVRRIRYAAISPFVSRDNRTRFNFSRPLATAAGIAISGGLRGRDLSPGYFSREVAFGYAGHIQNSLLTEFEADLKAFGRRVWRALRRDNRPLQTPDAAGGEP